MVEDKEFVESKHPRDNIGRFTAKGLTKSGKYVRIKRNNGIKLPFREFAIVQGSMMEFGRSIRAGETCTKEIGDAIYTCRRREDWTWDILRKRDIK